MASDNVEIELKIPVDEPTFMKIKKKLQQIAAFKKVSQQKDSYYSPAHRDFMQPEFPFEWLSIRKRDGKTIINYKHFYPENVDRTTHCDEFETEIGQHEQIEKIFSALNIGRFVTVDKQRETYVYNQEFEVALDIVAELGHFIEIEAIKNFGSVKLTREKLYEFTKQLGLEPSEDVCKGYPYLLLKKKSYH